MGAAAFLILLFFFLPAFHSSAQTDHYRRILHQPFFPVIESQPPTPTIQPPSPTIQPPFPSPQPQPQPQSHQPIKYPFSSQTTPPSQHDHFFPLYPSPPSPPSPRTPTTTLPTYPANISSITLPQPASSKPVPRKLVAIAVAVSLLSVALISAVAASLLYHRKRQNSSRDNGDAKGQRSDSLRLFPPNTATSDKPPPPTPPVLPPRSVSSTSSEFLYLGTLVSSRGADDVIEIRRKSGNLSNVVGGSSNTTTTMRYQRLGSPELHPLPPLPRHNFQREYRDPDDDEDNGELFFSPRGSSDAVKVSPNVNNFSSASGVFRAAMGAQNSSNPSSSSSSPTRTMSSSPSAVLNLSPRSLRSRSPDSVVDFPVQLPQERRSPGRVSIKLPPPPPPFPPPRFWESTVFPPQSAQDPAVTTGPPVLAPPTKGRESFEGAEQKNEEILKPKLKPLHWDKVRASSDRAMVWDQLKFSSFQLNEEMIETLFMVNSSNLMPKDSKNPHAVIPNTNQENRVLDPKKSQNIAILLRALNVTIDEVCEGLLEGNVDTLGTELLESLLKMSPTNEEEHKLKEFNETSPFKLGPAEKFLKAVIDIPFAFKRVDAMLYISNFDSEVEYLKRSFETLEAACEELRKSRMFLKLLEAVLKTGNRMNVGTNRGDAHAFKLDTLLKLVDVKGTDGKTTLLHFVVQEIIRAEGSRLSGADQDPIAQKPSDFRDDVEFRKLGLEVVSSLSGELSNVKKAAAMDSDVLISEAGRLAIGISKISEVLRLNEQLGGLTNSSRKFSESMTVFLKRAEEDITKIQAQESVALSMVKEITEYFHGNSAKEEAHPLRIFLVVRDFLSILDQVCKEVGKINERTTVSSARQFPLPLNQSEPSVFPRFGGKQHYSSSDDETSSSF